MRKLEHEISFALAKASGGKTYDPPAYAALAKLTALKEKNRAASCLVEKRSAFV